MRKGFFKGPQYVITVGNVLFQRKSKKEKESIMKKFVKMTLCGLAVMTTLAGCAKKDAEVAETSAAETEEIVDKGEISKLGQYKGVEVTKISTEVTDEELEASIQSILRANPEYIEITDRKAQDGDIVNIDYVGMKDGEAFEGGTAEGYDLELGSNIFIEGFEDGLIGAETGAEVSLDLTFPENYVNAELAGQAVVFDVTVNAIKEKKEAVLDDSFVQRISDFTTVDEFRADTLADLQESKESRAEQQIEKDALLAAMNNSEYNLNQAAVDQQYDQQLSYYNSMSQMYGMTMADYAAMLGMTEDEFKAELKIASENAIKQQLLVEAIAEKEGFQVEDADREAIAEQYGTDLKTLQDTYGEEAVDETANIYKVVNFIKENAVVK